MIMTKSGKIILAETKGEHLKNDDSREKIELGCGLAECGGEPVSLLHGVPGRGKSATRSSEHGAVCGDS